MKFQYKNYAKPNLQIFKFEPVKFCKSNNRLKNSQPVSQSPLRVRQTHTNQRPKTIEKASLFILQTVKDVASQVGIRHVRWVAVISDRVPPPVATPKDAATMSASPIARQATHSQSIPSRHVVINDASQLPMDYSTTPGGTLFSTTPGGEHPRIAQVFARGLRGISFVDAWGHF